MIDKFTAAISSAHSLGAFTLPFCAIAARRHSMTDRFRNDTLSSSCRHTVRAPARRNAYIAIPNLSSAPPRVGSIYKCEAAQKRRFILIPPYLSADIPRLPKQESLSFYIILIIERFDRVLRSNALQITDKQNFVSRNTLKLSLREYSFSARLRSLSDPPHRKRSFPRPARPRPPRLSPPRYRR